MYHIITPYYGCIKWMLSAYLSMSSVAAVLRRITRDRQQQESTSPLSTTSSLRNVVTKTDVIERNDNNNNDDDDDARGCRRIKSQQQQQQHEDIDALPTCFGKKEIKDYGSEEDISTFPTCFNRKKEDVYTLPSHVKHEHDDEDMNALPTSFGRDDEDMDALPTSFGRDDEDMDALPTSFGRNGYDDDDDINASGCFPSTVRNTSNIDPDVDYTSKSIASSAIAYNFSSSRRVAVDSSLYSINDFLKGAKWSPDGTCIISCCESNALSLYELPRNLYDVLDNNDVMSLSPAFRVQEASTIYDYAWYPGMSSWSPDTCFFATTSADHPVHLWDAFTGVLRASFRSYNQVDEITAPHSLAFSRDGRSLYCGFEHIIRVFDVSTPGRDYTSIVLRNTRRANEGLRGIVSAMDFCSVGTGLIAVGTYAKTIGLYYEGSSECVAELAGHVGGVTQVRFSPCGKYLFSGGRRDGHIRCWDVRNTGNVLYRLPRLVPTNQRVLFDLSACGRYLVTGNHDGRVSYFDLTAGTKWIENPCAYETEVDELMNSEHDIAPVHSFIAHSDTVNAAGFHPTLPLLVTASGQRHFATRRIMADVSDDEDDDDGDCMESPSLRIWRL